MSAALLIVAFFAGLALGRLPEREERPPRTFRPTAPNSCPWPYVPPPPAKDD